MELINANPEIREVAPRESRAVEKSQMNLSELIFEAIRDIRDPEHPHTLEELSVVDETSVKVLDPILDERDFGIVQVEFTPTVPHCSLASLIGLSIRTKVTQSQVLPSGYKLDISVVEGTHATDKEITKQLNDKERVAAALENPKLRQMVDECIAY
mmetsp:Transcript_13361/g.23982  ORF Transcript_13361/g.23982 Transcript_13361/m.23982 type:complete len:156 (+) Transcript_13361:60-527(+)